MILPILGSALQSPYPLLKPVLHATPSSTSSQAPAPPFIQRFTLLTEHDRSPAVPSPALELPPTDARHFTIGAHNQTTHFREISFGEGKLGSSIWDGGIALAMQLASDQGIALLSGKRVLELGSGVGLTGLVAARYADSVVLSDVSLEPGEMENCGDRMMPGAELLRNLERNVGLNDIENAEVQNIDWGCLGV